MTSKIGLPLGGQYCTEVDFLDAYGLELHVGDLITFHAGGSHEPLVTGRVESMWREDHPNVRHPMFFAEVEGGRRMWLHRDSPRMAQELEAEFGAIEGALW